MWPMTLPSESGIPNRIAPVYCPAGDITHSYICNLH